MDAVRGLLNFIAEARTKGVTDEEITDAANSIGRWEPSLVRAAVLGVDLTHLTNDDDHDIPPDLIHEHDTMAALDEYADRTPDQPTTEHAAGISDSPENDTPDSDDTPGSDDNANTADTTDSSGISSIDNDDTADSPETDHTDHADHDDTTVLPTPEHSPSDTTRQERTGVGATGLGAAGAYSASQGRTAQKPHPTFISAEQSNPKPEHKLPVLQAVIHHVALWIFLFSSIPTIIYLVHYLMEEGGNLGGTSTLTTFASILLVTGGFYGIMYGLYLRRARREPGLRTGKVLSIITLAGSTIGLIGSVITFIAVFLATVVFGDEAATSVLTSSALVIGVFLMTILTYFSTDSMQRNDIQHKLKIIAPIITGIILAVLFILAFIQLPSIADDQRTQDDVLETTEAIVEHTQEYGLIPTEEEFDELDTPDGVQYKVVEYDQYELCATFNHDTLSQYMRGEQYPMYDDSVSEWSFENHASGEHCFLLRSNAVHDIGIPPHYPEPIPYPMPSVIPEPEPRPTTEPQPEPSYSFQPEPQPTYTTLPIEPTMEPALS